MPGKVLWLIEHQVIYIHCYGSFTLTDLKDVLTHAEQMHRLAPNDGIHTICEARYVDQSTIGVREMRDILPIMRQSRRRGWVITINRDNYSHFLTSIFAKITMIRNRYTHNLDQSFEFLEQYDDDFELTADQLREAYHKIKATHDLPES